MSDPIGQLFGRLLTGWFGFMLGEKIEHQREARARLNDERIDAVENRVCARLYARLAKTKIDAQQPLLKGHQLRLTDLLGEAGLAQFALDTAEMVRRELQQQP
jgi:hypothetical protein